MKQIVGVQVHDLDDHQTCRFQKSLAQNRSNNMKLTFKSQAKHIVSLPSKQHDKKQSHLSVCLEKFKKTISKALQQTVVEATRYYVQEEDHFHVLPSRFR